MADTLVVDVRVRRMSMQLSVQLSAPPGFTVLMGPSGAGKSTTLLAIAGLVCPDDGRVALGDTVFFDGRDVVKAQHRRIGLVFQSLALFPHLTARENVGYGVVGDRAHKDAVAARWLARLRVDHVGDRRPPSFSGGEAQRVALARALAASPRLLLLDEPFSALDDELRRALRDDLKAVVAEAHIPVVFVTHDDRDAAALGVDGGQVVVLDHGRVRPP